MMNFMVGRGFYNRCKSIRATLELLRLGSTKGPCSSKSGEIKETKVESSCPQSKTPDSCPPPCPGPPTCPPRLSNLVFDTNNPCNYVPPVEKDPNYPDMTKMKKLQCKFQEGGDEIPVYLKGGNFNVIFYHIIVIVNLLLFLKSFHILYQLRVK